MATERSENTSAVFAENAETNIPAQPVTGTGYRNAATPDADIQAGHLYNSIAPSEIANQVLYKITAILQNIEQRGIAGWNPDTVYEQGAWVFGSDNFIYRAVQANPGSGRDPVVAANRPSHWERIEDVVVPSFATQQQAQQGTSPDTIISPAVLSQEFSRRLQGVGTGDLSSGRRVDTGVGLQGGGDLSVDRTISVRNGGIDTLELADNAVTRAKIAPDAVGSSEIAAGAVGTSEIADDAVTRDKIADDAVTRYKIADDAVAENQIRNAAVRSNHIGLNQVNAAHMATNSVGTSEIQTNAVGSSEIRARSVTDVKLSTQVTQAGRAWVRARQATILVQTFAVGSYTLAQGYGASGSATETGETVGGSLLQFMNIDDSNPTRGSGPGAVLSGVWRNMANDINGGTRSGSLFLRIS